MRACALILLAVAVTLTSFSQGIVSSGGATAGYVREHDWTVGRGNLRFGLEQYHRFYFVHRAPPEKNSEKRYTVVYCGPVRFELPCRANIVIAVLIAALLSFAAILFFGYSSKAKKREPKAI